MAFMRRGAHLFALVALVALVPAAPAATRPPRCTAFHGFTIDQSRELRLFFSRRSEYTYVCERRTGERHRIGEDYGSSSGYNLIDPAAVGGPVAAWQHQVGETITPPCFTRSVLHVREFGRRAGSAPAIRLPANGKALELVVKRNGSLAWIERRSTASDGCGDEFRYLVRRRDSRGRAVLASYEPGAAKPHDLGLHGSTLTWTDPAGTHTADLR